MGTRGLLSAHSLPLSVDIGLWDLNDCQTEEILAPLSTSAFLHYTQQPLPNAVEEALLLLPCVHPVAGDR